MLNIRNRRRITRVLGKKIGPGIRISKYKGDIRPIISTKQENQRNDKRESKANTEVYLPK